MIIHTWYTVGRLYAYYHKTCLAPPLFTEVPVLSQESERSCIGVLGEWILPLSVIFVYDFGTVLTV